MGNHWSLSTDAAEDDKSNCIGTAIETKTKGESATVLVFCEWYKLCSAGSGELPGEEALKDLVKQKMHRGWANLYSKLQQ